MIWIYKFICISEYTTKGIMRTVKSRPVIKLKIEDRARVIWLGTSSSNGIVDCSTDRLNDVAAKKAAFMLSY